MKSSIPEKFRLASMPWPTTDPFLFCVHHRDNYPKGNAEMGPAASLDGRAIGSDFSGKDGWSMYHGDKVPGFPGHPHRGFETITVARNGFIDHHDSLGANARFGNGDVQWMTAGKGVVHCEMFPLVHQDQDNPTELFQIWLNLPARQKLVDPHFTMFWSEDVPKIEMTDDQGLQSTITVIAGAHPQASPLTPPPNSWAADSNSNLAVWTLKMAPGAEVELPPIPAGAIRTLYFFEGDGAEIDNEAVQSGWGLVLAADAKNQIKNGDKPSEFLVLQGTPIAEPVAQHGPFVMNHPNEIRQAMIDYQNTGFGGWPWPNASPVHPREQARFALHADGRIEKP